MHGRDHVGSVDEIIFLEKPQGPRMLLLGGRSWLVNHVEWKRRVVYVEPVKEKGKAKWMGSGRPIAAVLARAIRSLLSSDLRMSQWSQRASEQMAALREEYDWVMEGQTTLLSSKGLQWFNFAGTLANMALAKALSDSLGEGVRAEALCVTFDCSASVTDVITAIETIQKTDPELLVPLIDDNAISGLKFSDCLSPELAKELLTQRYSDPEAVQQCLHEPIVPVVVTEMSDT